MYQVFRYVGIAVNGTCMNDHELLVYSSQEKIWRDNMIFISILLHMLFLLLARTGLIWFD